MGFLSKKKLIENYSKKQSTLISEEGEINYSIKKLKEYGRDFSFSQTYDIFLSHSYDDARIIIEIRDMLVEKGYKVYVDWIEDEHLERGSVSEYTATVLRNRMNNCLSLIYITSEAAESSLWMPWELGYMDAKTNRVAVAPILDEDDQDFEGREYLGLYPYLDLTLDNFFIQKGPKHWVGFNGWMKGQNPVYH